MHQVTPSTRPKCLHHLPKTPTFSIISSPLFVTAVALFNVPASLMSHFNLLLAYCRVMMMVMILYCRLRVQCLLGTEHGDW
jgi:hypothetical protein